MAAIDRTHIRKHLWPGVKFWFGHEYKDYPREYTEFMDVRTSDKAYEETVNMQFFGLGQEKIPGEAIMFDEAQEVYTARYVNKTYGLGFIVTREAVEDNQYSSLVPQFTRALKRSMVHTKEIRAVSVLNNAFDDNFVGGDGEPLISDEHPLGGGGTFSNLGAAADFSEGALEAAITDIGTWTDERGLLINYMPTKLIVANGGQFQAERVLNSEGRTYNANFVTAPNDINATRRMGALPQGYAVIHRLVDPDAWFLLTDVPNGLILFDRRALAVEEADGFDNQVVKYIATDRYSYGWSDPRGIYGNPGA